ncbi:MAG: cardiolipin synthase [Planctomycetaceae bacterium]|nr:cardiolipin synthase [Planctomycetaceae bacterium]
MESINLITVLVLEADLLIRIGFSVRVIMRRRPVGVSLAWLMIILAFPFGGAVIYLAFGETRLGNRRAKRASLIHGPYLDWLADVDKRTDIHWSRLGPETEALARLTEATVGLPPMSGNHVELIEETDAVFRRIIADVDAAQRTCHMVFYIWNNGGLADEVADALIRAAKRGVICRVLVDAVGSAPFLRSETAHRMREVGIRLHAALPVGLVRSLFFRLDLRMHRKIVVIDGEIGYTGSLNMVDPRYFKQGAGVGQWVDAMVRVRGPIVEGLALTFLEDWELDTGEGLEQLRQTGDVRALDEAGKAVVQVVPSGPITESHTIQQVLLMAIYAARRELVLTSPYFVPDELLLTALVSAARRGVEVTLIVPAKVDSLLVRLASQAHKIDLLEAGVKIALFEGGLLHTKSISVDGEFSLFGSLNLDPRSLWLNFEITLAAYDRDFTANLRRLQQRYIEHSQFMDLDAWRKQPMVERLVVNTARLLSPLI